MKYFIKLLKLLIFLVFLVPTYCFVIMGYNYVLSWKHGITLDRYTEERYKRMEGRKKKMVEMNEWGKEREPERNSIIPVCDFNIDPMLSSTLDQAQITRELQHAFLDKGYKLAKSSSVKVIKPGNKWEIHDSINKYEYELYMETVYLTLKPTLNLNVVYRPIRSEEFLKMESHTPPIYFISPKERAIKSEYKEAYLPPSEKEMDMESKVKGADNLVSDYAEAFGYAVLFSSFFISLLGWFKGCLKSAMTGQKKLSLYCPACNCRFVEGATRCVDCDVELLDEKA